MCACSSLFSQKILLSAFVVSLLLLGGCNKLDPYADAFAKVEIGDTRAEVIELMGQPSVENSVEVPLVKMETLSWHSPVNSRDYHVEMALNHVVSKSIKQ